MSLYEKERVFDTRTMVRVNGGPNHVLTSRGWQRQEQVGVSECGMPLFLTDIVTKGPVARHTLCEKCLWLAS